MTGQKQPNPWPRASEPEEPAKHRRTFNAKTFWIVGCSLAAGNFAYALGSGTFDSFDATERTAFQAAALLLLWLMGDKEVVHKEEVGPLREMLQRCIDANDAAVALGEKLVAEISLEDRRRMYREWFVAQKKANKLSFGTIFRKRAELGLQDDED